METVRNFLLRVFEGYVLAFNQQLILRSLIRSEDCGLSQSVSPSVDKVLLRMRLIGA